MSRLRAIWHTLVWLKARMKFTLHYMLVWEPMLPWASREEFDEAEERMATGPMRFEYARVEQLKERAIEAWVGK